MPCCRASPRATSESPIGTCAAAGSSSAWRGADGRLLATTYRQRWRPGNVFQILVEALRCEIDTMADPKAALFGFCTALVAYNAVAAVRAALRSAHGAATVAGQVSTYQLAGEV